MAEDELLLNTDSKRESFSKMLLKLLKSVLFLASMLIGSELLWPDVVWPLFKTRQAWDWEATSCVVVSSRLNTQPGLITTYAVDIVYSYKIYDKTYQSNRYSYTNIRGFDEVTAIVDRYPPNAEIACYVNPAYDYVGLPKHPTDAVIEQCDFPTALKRVFGVRPVVSLILVLFGIVGGLSTWSSFLARFTTVLVAFVVFNVFVYFTLVYLTTFFNIEAEALALFLPVGFIFFMMGYVDGYRQDVRTGSHWRPLAVSKHLTFVPAKFLVREPYITGTYRHHHLKLDIFAKSSGKFNEPYTRLVVSGNAPAQDSSRNTPSLPDERATRQDMIRLLTPISRHYLLKEPQVKGSVDIQIIDHTVRVCYEQRNIEHDVKYLGHLFDLFCNLAAAYPAVVALGGEAVPFLQGEISRKHHKSIAVELLEAIGRDTTARIGERASQLVCPSCLTYYQAHKVCPGGEGWIGRLFEGEIMYYGCRTCSQSRKFLEGRIIAVLDSGMNAELVQQDETLRVNWLARQNLFDFDEVDIVRATDEDVERLVCQVINDTDKFRRARYKGMSYKIAPDCRLLENSLRILQSAFG